MNGALQLLAGSIEFPLELGYPREVIGRLDRPAQLWLPLGFVEEADQQQLLAVALHRMDLDADRDGIAAMVRLRTRSGRTRMLPARLLDHRP